MQADNTNHRTLASCPDSFVQNSPNHQRNYIRKYKHKYTFRSGDIVALCIITMTRFISAVIIITVFHAGFMHFP